MGHLSEYDDMVGIIRWVGYHYTLPGFAAPIPIKNFSAAITNRTAKAGSSYL